MSESDFQFNLEEALDQQPKVMLRNPFGSNDAQVFFSSEERNQQLGMLEHLSRYSNLLSVVMGASGSGKTRFLQEFIRLQADSAMISHVNASMLMTAGQLLQAIYAGYADLLDSSNAGTSFGPLLKFSHEMEAKGQKAIILIDNAHELNTDAVIMLMDMMSLATESQEVPHVALFTEHSLAQNLDAYQQNRYQQLSHELTLEPFSLDQTRAYMLHRVRAIGGGINLPFNEKQVKKIYQRSQGHPGKINQAALAMMGDKNAAKSMQKGTKSSPFKFSGGLSFGFPVVHMALLSIVMLGILVAVIFSGGEDEAPANTASTSIAPISQAPRQASSETIARIEQMQRQIGQESPVSLPPIAANSGTSNGNNTSVSSVAPAPLRNNDSTSASEPRVSAPVLESEEPEVASAPEPASEPETVAPSDPFNQTQRWLERNPNRYTLQLLGTHNQDTVQDFIRDQGSLDAFSYFEALHNGRPWYVVVYGEYRNRSEAIGAVENLPGGLASLNPWARSVRGIQQDIRRANGQ
ncbi:SPOR domain-containing protein [Marinomonas ostreistagni]|uniref:SPOR domain-containing protein n=1 Tax=Marinomonas ostreistagni TaxID=359209 RepID=UPI001951684E|nr:AAA family ATPase [Marinomonas ostreistagni]MBM6550939.1 AAA family ATPase [Marinomonas ostreistagni]